MSIFTTTNEQIIAPKCEICQERNCIEKEPGKYKARCSHCLDRYDDRGNAYVIYCDFYRFTPNKRKKNGVTQQDLIFWVCDDVVQKAPQPWKDLWHSDKYRLIKELEEFDYKLSHITKADNL